MAETTTAYPSEAAALHPSDRVLLRVLVVLRWCGVAGMATVLVLSRHDLQRVELAWAADGSALAFTVWATLAIRRSPSLLLRPAAVAIELVVGVVLQVADGWALGSLRAYQAPALGSVWPIVGVMTAGIALGISAGGVLGATTAASRLLGALAPDVRDPLAVGFSDLFRVNQPRLVPTGSVVVLYVLAGAGAGYVARLQRRAEREVALARAREEVASELHDGVLQTLAVVQMRSGDETLSRLARDTARDLRSFLFGARRRTHNRLGDAIRAAADDAARRFDLKPEVVIADDLPDPGESVIAALTGAAAEALANVGRHAYASRVVVYAGRAEDGAAFVSVKDDGRGFDGKVAGGEGVRRSIRGRVEDAGGRVEIRSTPGRGTEVRLWAR